MRQEPSARAPCTASGHETDGNSGPYVKGRFPALAPPPPMTTRPEFAAAVRSAPRDLRRPRALEANPLSRSRLFVDHGMPLRDVLSNAIAGLVTRRGGDKAHQAATLAFLEGHRPRRRRRGG
ncbi:hypothetical protein [Streptomyces sp. NRRL S-37]|uniref:hypothetical protein n=1 Tax=Streptomyces sp. NRRL S-37 TaxID=1463903 RepID=UPI00131D333B|nr:hypothetical protein [Streptomyces sp. NRRL S-37]